MAHTTYPRRKLVSLTEALPCSIARSLAFPQLRADLYTDGDYVLHLDSDVVLLDDITYSHIFHLGKPVLPFRRYRNEAPEGELFRVSKHQIRKP